MSRIVLLTLILAAALLAGCGGDGREAAAATPEPAGAQVQLNDTAAAPRAPMKAKAARRGKTIKAVGSQFGRILADGRGQAVYLFDKERTAAPECYGECAKAWPPVLTNGPVVAGRGAKARLGTTRRRDGRRQVTVGGRPLYYYVRDAPGRVLCHNVSEFGGLWLVVRPGGTPAS